MTYHHFRLWPFAVLAEGLGLSACGTAEARVESEGYPNEAWQELCSDAERGDAKARRAIGLHYWRGWWPAERDLVRAYLWLSLATQANDIAAANFRDLLGDAMTGHEIVEAERRLRRWTPGRCALGADRPAKPTPPLRRPKRTGSSKASRDRPGRRIVPRPGRDRMERSRGRHHI